MNTAALLTHPVPETDGLAKGAHELSPWFHNVHLPDGTQTAPTHPLGDFPAFKWQTFAEHIPADLSDWRALDIGCNAGFYSLELARRGASVVALDVDPHFLRQARWLAAQFEFGHRIEIRQGQVHDLVHWSERFDLVLFMGVFYHLRYPLLALDLVAEHATNLLVFQTLTLPGDDILDVPFDLAFNDRRQLQEPGWPKMAFIENKLAGDSTNWWAPSHSCVEAMLRSAGFKITGRPAHEIFLCEPNGGPGQRCNRSWDESELRAATGRGRLAASAGNGVP
jgi:tRNA (mo5U34)-methyltransferase